MFITILLNLFRVLGYKNKLGGQLKMGEIFQLYHYTTRLAETSFIVVQISVLEKQYKGSVSQKKHDLFQRFWWSDGCEKITSWK